MSIELLKAVTQSGLRVFDKKDVEDLSDRLALSKKYIPRMLSLLAQKESILSLGKGLYSLPPELLAGGPLHSFEIAMKLAKKGAISHRSAMIHYNLIDQMISRVYVTVPKEQGANLSTIRDYELMGTHYHLIRVTKEHYWGIKKVFIGETRILITDIERTLLDGLDRPEYCGGMREVLYAFEQGLDKASPHILYDYALKSSLVVSKRLGWVLERLGQYTNLQYKLQTIPMDYYQKLDPTGKRIGKYNKTWKLVENI